MQQLALWAGFGVLAAVLGITSAVLCTSLWAAVLARRLVAPYRAVLRQTEQRFENSLADSQRERAQMATIFEHMADGLLVLDANERIALSNPAAVRLVRQPRLEGLPLAEAVRD
ncbi:MAG TPA: PAS domain-containing protein, partial [Chloroflexota bacterium]